MCLCGIKQSHQVEEMVYNAINQVRFVRRLRNAADWNGFQKYTNKLDSSSIKECLSS